MVGSYILLFSNPTNLDGGVMKNQNMRTGLAQAKGLGSAKEGVHHWLMQRLSAVFLLFLITWLIYTMFLLKGKTYHEIHHCMQNPFNAAGMFLSIATMSYHAMLGVQVVIEDYVHHFGWRTFSLIVVKFIGYALPALSLFFLIKIMG